jgi:hypothetical protein
MAGSLADAVAARRFAGLGDLSGDTCMAVGHRRPDLPNGGRCCLDSYALACMP